MRYYRALMKIVGERQLTLPRQLGCFGRSESASGPCKNVMEGIDSIFHTVSYRFDAFRDDRDVE
jgi:hypothetical protein